MASTREHNFLYEQSNTYEHAAALKLVRSYLYAQELKNKAQELAMAEFRGMCKMLDTLGKATTDTEAHIVTMTAIREATETIGPRPAYRASGSNESRVKWEEAAAARLSHLMTWEAWGK